MFMIQLFFRKTVVLKWVFYENYSIYLNEGNRRFENTFTTILLGFYLISTL